MKIGNKMFFSSTTRPYCKRLFWVATPVGQVFALHCFVCTHPAAIIIARAELHISAPNAMFVSISKPLVTFPLQIIFILSRTLMPTNALWTKTNPASKGVPIKLVYSTGAAPVPPSAPSTVIKSGKILVFTIALHMAKNSSFRPRHNLNPMGLPPENSRNFLTKSSKPMGC